MAKGSGRWQDSGTGPWDARCGVNPTTLRAKVLRKPGYWISKPSFGVVVMNGLLLEKLIEEKQRLRTELVQAQSMLHLVDDRILEELLMEVQSSDEPVVNKVDQG